MSGFIDTNIFIRLVTQDDRAKAIRCFELLERANRGEIDLVTSEAVIAETVFVLASPRLYGTPREEITSRLGALLTGSRLRLDHKETVLEALELYGSTNLHFVDCLCLAHARRPTVPHAVYSYDRGLGHASDIPRLEP